MDVKIQVMGSFMGYSYVSREDYERAIAWAKEDNIDIGEALAQMYSYDQLDTDIEDRIFSLDTKIDFIEVTK